MYLVTIHVPIYVDGGSLLLATDWKRSLLLLRDSFDGRFGPVTVLAPRLPASGGASEQSLERADREDGLLLVPSFDLRCRARSYWLRERRAWRRAVREHVARADVVHAGVDDLWRPITFEGLREGFARGVATVLVEDTDVALQVRQSSASLGLLGRLRARAYASGYERRTRWGVARADLSLLKGDALMRRYGGFARNAHEFHDTSFTSREIVPEDVLEARLARLRPGRPLRLVYCGRLLARKGVVESVRLVGSAARAGADLTLDLIGDGPEREAVLRAAAEEGVSDRVCLAGSAAYGPGLLARLAGYDALLFTPTAEDTPRMIFDGYASGLPLVASPIPYVRQRHREEGATLMLPEGPLEARAEVLVGASRDPGTLAPLARRARAAAAGHAADVWYSRRAAWTVEAWERRRAGAVTAPVRG